MCKSLVQPGNFLFTHFKLVCFHFNGFVQFYGYEYVADMPEIYIIILTMSLQ